MLRLILVAIFVLGFLAVRFLPWWVTLSAGIVLILLSKFLAGRFFLWLFSLPFRAKGKVLHGAQVEVHSVRPAPPPPPPPPPEVINERRYLSNLDDDEDDDSDSLDDDEPAVSIDIPRDFYEVEATITPRESAGPFQHWEYTEITLTRPGRRWYEDDDSCEVVSVERADGAVIIPVGQRPETEDDEYDDDGTKVAGPLRVKILVGVKPGLRELVFAYYFEHFGRVELRRD